MTEIKHTCGKCSHWYKSPLNPADITAKNGDCRESPPGVTLLPTNIPGQLLANVGYPVLAHNYTACDRFQARLEITE